MGLFHRIPFSGEMSFFLDVFTQPGPVNDLGAIDCNGHSKMHTRRSSVFAAMLDRVILQGKAA